MKTKVSKLTSNSIEFDNGYELTSAHCQNCCENHYLDFSYVKPEDVEGLEFDLSNDKFFRRLDGYGVELIPIHGFSVKIPGYGRNNGYYGTNIDLVVSVKGNEIARYDVSECQNISY